MKGISLRRYLAIKQPARITIKRRKHAKQLDLVKHAYARAKGQAR